MEEKVQNVLHLLQEDGDSFAKRAEMYYKKRPELINFVEETYRAYRALAERYEKISTDLQNANTTIASVFPEQVQFSMDDDEDDGTLSNFKPRGKDLEPSKPSIPKVPAPPKKNLKSLLTTATKNLQSNKAPQRFKTTKSGLTEGQAVAEIDKLQKEILTLQTEKEFVKSAYENKLARYYHIDKEISEMQERIGGLQDEFNVGLIIEDDEARTLMASTALKSCQDTLTLLEEKQEGAETHQQSVKSEKRADNGEISPVVVLSSGRNEESNGSLSMTDMAEKIDELVQKVISLETQFSSQTAQVIRLRSEADELQKQVLSLEADKAALIDDANILNKKLQEMLDKSPQVLASSDTNKTLHETEENSLQVLPSDNGPEHSDIITSEPQSFDTIKSADATTDRDNEAEELAQVLKASKQEGSPHTQIHTDATDGGMNSGADEKRLDETSSQTKEPADEDEANWQELFMNGLQDKEKVILKEYTTTLRNYKDLKKKLTDIEKKNNDTLLEFVTQIRELRSAVSKKDEEIQSLHQKLSFLKDHNDSSDGKIPEEQNGELPNSAAAPGDQDNADDDRVLKEILSSKNLALSPVEEKFRSHIDGLLEENLNFWLRFSSAFHQIQKFQTEVEDLQAELGKIEEKKIKKQDSSSSSSSSKHRNLKSDVLPIYKHLSEINAEISVWLEQSVQLKEELESRFSSLCNIQDEISAALVAACGAIEEAMFTSYQAAKFQGEVLNMKQENNKVDDELQSAIDHATRVQVEIEKSLGKLDEDYKISESKIARPNQPKLTHSESRNRVPLQSFIFGVKPKKQRYSIFSVMHPAMLKRHHDLKTGL